MTKVNKIDYLPTPTEIQIIDIMLDPEHLDKTIGEKCEMLGISRTTYYNYMNKPEFMEFYIAMAKEAVRHNTGALVSSAVKFAKNGSFQHFKYLMEMGDIHKEDNKMLLEGAIEHIVTFGRGDDDDQDELPSGRTIIDMDPEE